MTMTINKDSFPRFTKRLKKSLQKHGIELPLNKVQEVAAQSLGKENYYELNTLFNHEQNNLAVLDIADELPTKSNESPISLTKDYDWIIEEASLQIGMSMGRPGWAIGSDHIKTAINKAVQHILSKNPRVTLTLEEANNLVTCYEGDKETEITISRFKDDNKLYGWFTEYPEEGRILLETDNGFPKEMQTLTPQLQLPYYQNLVLCLLGALITDNPDYEQLVIRANSGDKNLFEKDSSYNFYLKKSPFFAHKKIEDIILGHKSNLTVICALLDYIKNRMSKNTLNIEHFSFLKSCSPIILDLVNNFNNSECAESVHNIKKQYYSEKKNASSYMFK